MIKNLQRFWWTALLVAWFFDFLFWEKSPGISFVIFVGMMLFGGFFLTWREGEKPSRASLWLLIPIFCFALGTFFRREPLTSFTNYLLTLVLMGVLAHTFRRGRWLNYSLSDYIAVLFYLTISALVKPIEIFNQQKDVDVSDKPSKWKRATPILRGIVIALPIVLIFASLLAAADPIFEQYIQEFIQIFKLENLPEYFFRGFCILILAYLLTGIYLHALTTDKEVQLIGEENPWLPNFLGFTESAIVLGSVNTLFVAFVSVQFRYFFGGNANIKIDGYTYAEYARRGFGELVVVAVFSLLLFIGLSTISKREIPTQRKTFSGLGIGLFVLVAVILISAFQRLLLYEQAYGFTRLRMYAHIFMIWLGILLAAVVVLELIKRQRAFALALVMTIIGFGLTLNFANVDRLIVIQNVQRALSGTEMAVSEDGSRRASEELDAYYFQSLSTDAAPALINALKDPHLPNSDRGQIAAVLACQITLLLDEDDPSWQSFHWADSQAIHLLTTHRDDFSMAQVYQNEWDVWWVQVQDEERPCRYDPYRYD